MSSTSSMPTLMRTSSGSTPAASQRLGRELAVGRATGVDDERARVADVGQVRAQLDAADERLARLAPALAAEGEHRARALRQVLARERVVRVVREAGVADPAHPRVEVEPLRDLLRVGHVGLHPQRQRLHALQDQEGVERRQHAAEVAQALDAQLGGEAVLAEVVPEAQVAVGGDRLGHHREVAVVPREAAGVDDRAADRGAVAAEVLGRRVQDDVGAEVQRPAQVRATRAWSRRRAGRPRRARPSPAPRGRRPCRPGWPRSRCRRASCGRAGPRRRTPAGRRARRTSSRCRAGAGSR